MQTLCIFLSMCFNCKENLFWSGKSLKMILIQYFTKSFHFKAALTLAKGRVTPYRSPGLLVRGTSFSEAAEKCGRLPWGDQFA